MSYTVFPSELTHTNPRKPLKKTGAGNLFMVFGEPDVEIKKQEDGQIMIEIKGVDVYDPTTGQIRNASTDDIACWFIDSNYNGESFFVRHAYFTEAEEPYDKPQRTLRAEIDEAAWSSLYNTVSRPFDKQTAHATKRTSTMERTARRLGAGCGKLLPHDFIGVQLPGRRFEDVTLIVHHADGAVTVALQRTFYSLLVSSGDVNRSLMSAELATCIRHSVGCLDLDRDVGRLDVRPLTLVVFSVVLVSKSICRGLMRPAF